MGTRMRLLAAGVVGVVIFFAPSSSSLAALTVLSGSLHAAADGGAPPDAAYVAPSTTLAGGSGYPNSWATQTVYESGGQFHIDVGLANRTGFIAVVSGSATLVEDATELAQATLTGSSLPVSWGWNDVSITLKNASNQTLFQFHEDVDGFTPTVNDSTVIALVPGTYTLTWSGRATRNAGYGGDRNYQFTLAPGVPEPTALALAAAALTLVGRRRP